jgi:acetyl-CoA synthetase
VTLRPGYKPSEELKQELLNHVKRSFGAIAVPENIFFVEKLPKTRSAKIMRRIIGAVVQGKPVGDVTTLEDETSVEEAKRAYEEFRAQLKQAQTK